MIKTAVMKLLTVKAGAVVILAVAGGVAVAATTGTLPTTLTGSGHGTSGLSAAASHGAGKPSARPSASDKGKNHDGNQNGDSDGQNGNQNGNQNGDQNGKGPEGANGSPSPSLVGLCHAVNAGNKDDHGKALENPAFAALITAAGGKEKVDAFCTALLASASAAPKEHPSHPADNPGDHGTGKPSAPAQS